MLIRIFLSILLATILYSWTTETPTINQVAVCGALIVASSFLLQYFIFLIPLKRISISARRRIICFGLLSSLFTMGFMLWSFHQQNRFDWLGGSSIYFISAFLFTSCICTFFQYKKYDNI